MASASPYVPLTSDADGKAVGARVPPHLFSLCLWGPCAISGYETGDPTEGCCEGSATKWWIVFLLGCCIGCPWLAVLYAICVWRPDPSKIIGDSTQRTVNNKFLAGCCIGFPAISFWEKGDLTKAHKECTWCSDDSWTGFLTCFFCNFDHCFVCCFWKPDVMNFRRSKQSHGGGHELVGAPVQVSDKNVRLGDLPRAQVIEALQRLQAAADEEKRKNTISRGQRLEVASQKAATEAKALHAMEHGDDKSDEESTASEKPKRSPKTPKPKAPVALQKVVFWSQQHSDGESIPTELLQLAYREIDKDCSGSIMMEELVSGLAECGLHASQTVMESIMLEIDKNSDGTISIVEFVDFFRHLEELTAFNAKNQARAEFFSLLLNLCFIAHIVIVGVLVMSFINMDEAADPDTYAIMQSGVFVFGTVFVILFCCVILIPALRLALRSLGIAGFETEDDKPKDQAGQSAGNPAAGGSPNARSVRVKPGPKGNAWSAAAGGATVNQAAMIAATNGPSYRVSSHMLTNDAAWDAPAQDFASTLGSRPGQDFNNTLGSRRSRSQRGGSEFNQSRRGSEFRSEHGSQFGGSAMQSLPALEAPPEVIMNTSGEFLRYDPSQYRVAALRALDAGASASFNSMQVQNLHMPHPFDREEFGGPGEPV